MKRSNVPEKVFEDAWAGFPKLLETSGGWSGFIYEVADTHPGQQIEGLRRTFEGYEIRILVRTRLNEATKGAPIRPRPGYVRENRREIVVKGCIRRVVWVRCRGNRSFLFKAVYEHTLEEGAYTEFVPTSDVGYWSHPLSEKAFVFIVARPTRPNRRYKLLPEAALSAEGIERVRQEFVNCF